MKVGKDQIRLEVVITKRDEEFTEGEALELIGTIRFGSRILESLLQNHDIDWRVDTGIRLSPPVPSLTSRG